MGLHLVPMTVLQFLVIGFCQTSVVTHTLQYTNTAVTPRINFPDFSVVGLVDGEQFVYYDGNISKVIPKMKWIQKFNAYWKRETQRIRRNLKDLHHLLRTVMKEFNHTEGVHTLQMMYGCELDDDGTTRGYDQYGYDGEDFISLDLNTETWTAANDKAVIVKHKWEETGPGAKHWKYYLENECIDWLNKFVSHGRETLERKGEEYEDTGAIHQEDYQEDEDMRILASQEAEIEGEELVVHLVVCKGYRSVLEWPVIITVSVGFIIILIVVLLGFVIWRGKKNKSAYLPDPSSPITSSKLDMIDF